ncbi:oligomeric golgi complex component, COG2-domain-containing protein [Daldinia caldariorum]|uniref:oligomeric golgi complex component, COG2-domain-containing protein n=1 Tax=Daldinia caldariorum TaxID=326644 RepID=UPI00200845ED|nr:oligomeric golgi complex component, COG2-domain-containing protein [Daldinia caldariorum]KAI1469628.1 oligomeric golgi complex component, COG2-domain-containing protein [Daldinia caldariorum]
MSHLAAPSPARPVSSRSFALVSSSESSDNEDDAPLPFPTALPRSDFLAPDFDPAEYLSSLANRHQTLEDLRSDLRERSAAISTELLELVNANYTSFLSLGDELKGGEEKVEDVRVALLGFRRAVEEIKGRVRERGTEVASLNRDLSGVRSEIETGRKMLELDERLSVLEGRLAVGSTGPDSDDSDEDDGNDENELEGAVGNSTAKLTRLANEYTVVDELANDIGRDTPFVRKAEERLTRCRNTILLDLGTALKEATKAGTRGQAKLLKLMGIYSRLDAQLEAVKVLKSA